MPINIFVGLVALLVALIMYSIASWGAFRSKSVTRRHATYLWIGFGFDVLATAMMAVAAGGLDLSPLSDLLHTVVAFVALFGMMAAAIMASRAVAAQDRVRREFAKWVLAPWSLWLVVFVWGMLSRGAQRMG